MALPDNCNSAHADDVAQGIAKALFEHHGSAGKEFKAAARTLSMNLKVGLDME